VSKNPINESGKAGEDRLLEYLEKNKFSYRQQITSKKQIDFIINPDSKNSIYIDVTNQNGSGSVGDKVPHKVWKYYKKYGYDEVYILMGKYDLRKKMPLVVQHCNEVYKFKTHFVNFKEMTNILEGEEKNNTIEKFC